MRYKTTATDTKWVKTSMVRERPPNHEGRPWSGQPQSAVSGNDGKPCQNITAMRGQEGVMSRMSNCNTQGKHQEEEAH